MVSVPSTVAARVVSPSSPPPGSMWAPPTPLSSTSTTMIPLGARDADLEPRRCGVLGGVRQSLGDHEVRRGLDRHRRPRVEVDRDLDGDRASCRERRERRIEAAVGEDRRVDSAREVAQLRECLLRVLVRLLDERPCSLRVGVELGAGASEVDRERGQPLLRAVVEVALDAPPLGDGSVDRLGALLRQLRNPLG